MPRWKPLVLLLFCGLLWTPRALADSSDGKTDLAANAALQYWQAFAQMPALDKEQEKILEGWATVPLDDAALKLINASQASRKYLHRGAKLPRCDWGLDYDDGLGLLLPQLAKARDLARLAALHGRYEFEHGNRKAARADAAAIMALGRHVGRDPIMICFVVRFLIEDVAIDLVAPYVLEIKASHAHAVAMFEALPPAATLEQVIAKERRFGTEYILEQLKQAEKTRPGSWRELWMSLLQGSEVPEAVRQVDTLDEAVAMLEALRPVYDDLAKLVVLPPDEFAKRYPPFKTKTKAAHPLAGLLIPAVDQIRARQQRNEARLAMLLASTAVVEEGPEKLKDLKDPFGTGPFEYRALDKGFELKSKLLFEDQPVTLTVGQPIKK